MSITYLCPHCSKSTIAVSRPIKHCSHCGKSLPTDLQKQLNENFRIERPILLTLLMCFNYFGVIVTVLVMMMALFVEGAEFSIYGEEVSREEFINKSFTFMLLIGLLSGITAYGLQKNRKWTRPLCMICAGLPFIAGLYQTFFVMTDFSLEARMLFLIPVTTIYGSFALFGWWYLYKKKTTQLYYHELQYEQGEGEDF